eukprot:gene11311-22653_t
MFENDWAPLAVKKCANRYYSGMGDAPPKAQRKPGDWFCPIKAGGCGNFNFAKRGVCKACDKLRPPPTDDQLRQGWWHCDKNKELYQGDSYAAQRGCGVVNPRNKLVCMGCQRNRPAPPPPLRRSPPRRSHPRRSSPRRSPPRRHTMGRDEGGGPAPPPGYGPPPPPPVFGRHDTRGTTDGGGGGTQMMAAGW